MKPGAIISAPDGGYASAYWVVLDDAGTVAVELATSPDLRFRWTWRTTLAEDATQPTIEPASDGGWVVGWEDAAAGPSPVRVLRDLGRPARRAPVADYLDVPIVLAGTTDCAEGTPSLYSASRTAPRRRIPLLRSMRGGPAGPREHRLGDLVGDIAPGLRGGVPAARARRWGSATGIRSPSAASTSRSRKARPSGSTTRRSGSTCTTMPSASPDQLDLRAPAGCVAFTNPMVELVAYEGDPAVVVTTFVRGRRAGLRSPARCCSSTAWPTERSGRRPA